MPFDYQAMLHAVQRFFKHAWRLSIGLHLLVLVFLLLLAQKPKVIRPTIIPVSIKTESVQKSAATAHKHPSRKTLKKIVKQKKSVKKPIKRSQKKTVTKTAKKKIPPVAKKAKKIVKKKTPPRKADKKPIKKPAKPLLKKPAINSKALDQALMQAQHSMKQDAIAKHQARLLAAIAAQWNVPPDLPEDVGCELAIALDTSGRVLSVRLVKTSGIEVLDRSAIQAVHRASPLPMPKDVSLTKAFLNIELLVRPDML